jgi:hypothetical protein
VLIRLLRKHGCSLPVQFWYHGKKEMDDRMKKLVEPYGVECVDAQKVARRAGKRVGQGWPLKPFSILHSPFEEVLALDADNCPIRNPEYLFENNAFLETGATFWPDVGRTEPARPIWDTMGVPFRSEPEFESGQIVVNKARAWEPLNLAMWMNEPGRAEFFYKMIWGDKDTFRFAWHKFGFPFAMTPVPLQMLSVAGGPCCAGVMCQHDLEGERIFQHRNLLKWQLYGDNPRVPGYFFEGESRDYLDELRSRWNGRIGMSGSAPQPIVKAWRRRLKNDSWLIETVIERKPTQTPLAVQNLAVAKLLEGETDVAGRVENASTQVKLPLKGDEASQAPEALPETPDGPAEAVAAFVQPIADPWPVPRARSMQEVRFIADGHCESPDGSQFVFWDVEKGKAGMRLRLAGRDGVGKAIAHLRLQPDGSWRGRTLDKKNPTTLRLRRIGDVYPSGIGAGPQRHSPIPRQPVPSTRVFHSSMGIGDHIVALYACVAAADLGRVTFHTRYPEWFERVRHPNLTITGDLPPNPKRAIDFHYDYQSQLRYASDCAKWYGDAIVPRLAPKRPGNIDRTIQIPRFDFDRYVVVAPFSAWARRDWPGANWTRLTHLLREAAYEVVAIGVAKDAERFDKVFGQTTALWAIEHPPEWVADAMLGAACVIGNDSGMTHYAGLLDVPTLSIHAHLPPEFLFAGTSVRSITPKTNCTFCRWQHDRGYNSACDAACSALGTIGPEDVLRAFHELVKHPNRRPAKSERVWVVDNREGKGSEGDRNGSAPKLEGSARGLDRSAGR